MLSFNLDVSSLEKRLEGARDALRDLRPVWPEVHTVFTEFVKKNFETEGGYTGEGWKPLNPSYAAWKAANYGSKGIMHLTERLYPSLVDEGHTEHIAIFGPTFAEFGTSVPYAKAQHFGRPEISLPARVLIPGPTKVEGKKIADIFKAFIFKTMRLVRGRK